jgi:recombination protein RecA
MNEYDLLFKDIEKQFGSSTIGLASKCGFTAKPLRLKTDIFALDIAIGGGIPLGKTITVAGPYSSGKSIIAYKIAAAFQRYCRHCKNRLIDWNELQQQGTPIPCCEHQEPNRVVWIDAEKSYDVDWSARLSINNDAIHVGRADTAEKAIDIGTALIKSGQVDLIVVDSIAMLTPKDELKDGAGKWQRALHARLMNKMCRLWRSASDRLDVQYTPTILLINQDRESLNPYGKKTVRPGGRGIGFASAVILEVRKRGMWADELDRPVGQGIEVSTEKNKTSIPKRSAEFSVAFVDCEGFIQIKGGKDDDKPKVSTGERKAGSTDLHRQIFLYASFWDLIKRKGSWYELAGKSFQGEKNLLEFLSSKKKLLRMLGDEIWRNEFKYIGQEGRYYERAVKQKKVNKPREEAK